MVVISKRLAVAAILATSIGRAFAGLGEPSHETVVEKKKFNVDTDKIEHPKMQAHHQGHLDSSINDHMTDAEILEEFRRADKNHDGYVTLTEFETFLAEEHEPEVLEDDKPEDNRKPIGGTHKQHDLDLFHDIDRNNDKKISFKEFEIHLHKAWEEHKEEYHKQIHEEL